MHERPRSRKPLVDLYSGGLALLLITAVGCFEDVTSSSDPLCVCGWEVLETLREEGPPIDTDKGTAADYDLVLSALDIGALVVSSDQALELTWQVEYEAVPCQQPRVFDTSGTFEQVVVASREGSPGMIELGSIEREMSVGQVLEESLPIEPGTLAAMAEPVLYTIDVSIVPVGVAPVEGFPLMQCVDQGDALVYAPRTENDSGSVSVTVVQ